MDSVYVLVPTSTNLVVGANVPCGTFVTPPGQHKELALAESAIRIALTGYYQFGQEDTFNGTWGMFPAC